MTCANVLRISSKLNGMNRFEHSIRQIQNAICCQKGKDGERWHIYSIMFTLQRMILVPFETWGCAFGVTAVLTLEVKVRQHDTYIMLIMFFSRVSVPVEEMRINKSCYLRHNKPLGFTSLQPLKSEYGEKFFSTFLIIEYNTDTCTQ